MAYTNLLQHNPGAANQENDTAYSGDALRTAGVGVNAIVPSAWLNKALYQVTTFAAAFGQMLAIKGTTTSDANLSTLTTALGQVAVLNDITIAVGTETTNRTSAVATVQGNIATVQGNLTTEIGNRTSAVATVQAGVNAINAPNQTLSGNGHVTLPGGVIFQWFNAVTVTESGDSIHAVTFPYTFPNNCFSVQVSTYTGQGGPGSAGDTDIHTMQLSGSPTTTGCSVRHSVGGVYGQTQTLTAFIFAIGN